MPPDAPQEAHSSWYRVLGIHPPDATGAESDVPQAFLAAEHLMAVLTSDCSHLSTEPIAYFLHNCCLLVFYVMNYLLCLACIATDPGMGASSSSSSGSQWGSPTSGPRRRCSCRTLGEAVPLQVLTDIPNVP